MSKNKKGFLVLSDTVNVEGVPKVIKILPVGNVKSRKGPFVVDRVSFNEMLEYFKDRQLDVVVDYEHQTLDGTEAPAAGWIKGIEFTDEGVMARVEWTEKAKGYLANKEYRYLSPVVFKRNSDSRAVMLHSVALTNTPAIDGMEPIINSLNFDLEGGIEMEFIKQMAKVLGLAEDATEEQVLDAIKKLNDTSAQKQKEGEAEIVANKEILEALELNEKATVEDVKGKIISLKNPAGFVSAEDFKKLQEKIQKKESDDLVQVALSQGKITPAQKEWASVYALKDPTGFKNFVDNAPQVVPFEEIVIGGGDNKKKVINSEMQISVNKMLGVSDEDLKKYGGEE